MMYRRDERDTARASGRAQRGKPIDFSEKVSDENTLAMRIDKLSDLAI